MSIASNKPVSGYRFNSFDEIRSHSSVLFNERLAILFYMLDMKAISMNTGNGISDILETRAILKQVYKNIRSLLFYNPLCRATLNLQTKDDGIYVTDVMQGLIDRMLDDCEKNGYTSKKVYIVIRELNNFEMTVKAVLQYFHYFIRPDFRQKPDIDLMTESYKEIADRKTIGELRDIVGENNLIDFDTLGVQKIEGPNALAEAEEGEDISDAELIEYDAAVDGDVPNEEQPS